MSAAVNGEQHPSGGGGGGGSIALDGTNLGREEAGLSDDGDEGEEDDVDDTDGGGGGGVGVGPDDLGQVG